MDNPFGLPAASGDLQLSRRGLLRAGVLAGGGALSLGLLGCSGTESRVVTQGRDAPEHALLAAFPQSVPHVAVGVPTRLPYLVSDREGVPLSAMAGPVTFTVSQDGRPVGADVVVQPHSDGVPRAYLPLGFTFSELGLYDIAATYGGERLDSQLQVYSLDDVTPPVVGEPLPPLDTPTPDDSLGVDPMCSRVPTCPFHKVNLRQAVGSGKRIVLLVASPAYCQTTICGPVLDNLVDLAANRDDLVVIHCEVYKNPKAVRDLSTANLAPVPDSYDLAFEPVMFVTDTAGAITARADVIVDRQEMAQLIA